MLKFFLLFALLLLTVPAAFSAGGGDASKGGADPDKEMDEIVKEIGDFHGQAEQMMKQLEQKMGVAQQGGQAPNPLDQARQKAMRLASDDRFLKSATDLWNNPNRPKMLYIQAAFFVFMLIFKAWRQSKVFHWFKKMLLGFFLTIFTWVGIAYVIPLIVLGEPFAVFTTTLFRVIAF